MKRLLIIFLLMSSMVSASDFNVSWTPIKEDIVNKEYRITIQNLDTDMQTVDIDSFFEDTNFDTSKIRDVEFYEQAVKPVTKEIKHYKTIQVSETISHIDNKTGMLINTTKMVNKHVLDYVEKKTVNEKVFNKQKTKVLKSDKKMKEVLHGKITLPSVKTVGKINNAGTKIFILKFKTPPDGSHGKVGLKINGKEYHPYWNSTWSNRKKITLTGNTSEPLLDCQLLLNITYEPEMNPDFSDIRVCNDTDQLSAWLESKVNESYALIWIKFPHIPAIGETEDYWIYYGNSEANAYWDGNATFEFFDDFEDGDVDGWEIDTKTDGNLVVDNNAAYSGNYGSKLSLTLGGSGKAVAYRHSITALTKGVLHVKAKPVQSTTKWFIYGNIYNNPKRWLYADPSDHKFKYYDSAWHTFPIDTSWIEGNWYNIEIKFDEDANTFDMKINGTVIGSDLSASNDMSSIGYVLVFLYNYVADLYLDNWFIRKYVANPPTVTFGTEQYYVDSIYFNSSNSYYNLIDYKGDIAVNHSYYSSDDLEWTASALNNDTGLVVTSMGSLEIDFTIYENVLDWLQLVNLDNSKIYTLQNSSGDIEEHQASGNVVNFTTDLSPDDYEIEITAVPTPSPTVTPTGVQPANYSGTKLSDSTIKSFYYPFMYILFIIIIIGGFMHVFGN